MGLGAGRGGHSTSSLKPLLSYADALTFFPHSLHILLTPLTFSSRCLLSSPHCNPPLPSSHRPQGPIGPESLKSRFGLLEADVLRLYLVLYLYSVGFCAALLEPTERARDREQLLEAVFKAFAQLWDEALGVSEI